MTNPEGLASSDEAPDADVADQVTSPDADADRDVDHDTDDGDEDTWAESGRIGRRRDWDASEADLIDQAIVAPLPEDEREVD